jgi:5-formyltetrahydrofolate cyclo-ligase
MQAATPSPDADKPTWRNHFKSRLAAAPATAADSGALRALLAGLLRDRPPSRIAAFAALPGEPEVVELLETLPDHRWFFPRVDRRTMTFHPLREAAELVPGNFGIPEPPGDGEPLPVRDLDLVLCPGLGFGRDGSRLGRGGGYYDRVLAACRADTEIIGIAFEPQIADRVPVEPHDIPLDRIATPGGWIDIARP